MSYAEEKTKAINGLVLHDMTKYSLYRLLEMAFEQGWRACYYEHEKEILDGQRKANS